MRCFGPSILIISWKRQYVIESLKGIDLIVSAMKKFPDDSLFQKLASQLLEILTTRRVGVHQSLKEVIEAAGHRVLVEALANFKDENHEHVEEIYCLRAAR